MIKYPVLLTNTKKKMSKKLDIITATDVKNIVQDSFFNSLEYTDETIDKIYERGLIIINETINSLITKRKQVLGRDVKYDVSFALETDSIRYLVTIKYLVFPNIINSFSLFIKKKIIKEVVIPTIPTDLSADLSANIEYFKNLSADIKNSLSAEIDSFKWEHKSIKDSTKFFLEDYKTVVYTPPKSITITIPNNVDPEIFIKKISGFFQVQMKKKKSMFG